MTRTLLVSHASPTNVFDHGRNVSQGPKAQSENPVVRNLQTDKLFAG